MPTKTAVELKGFSFSYGMHPVLQDFSLRVAAGSVHGIVGPNGTGKTTLFNAIFQHHKYPEISVSAGLEKEIAYLQTDTYFYLYMTGLEYLQILSGRKSREQINRWNQLFDLPLPEYIHHYSTGMKKKVALLGLILLDKKILLLDEPTNGLDLDSCEVVYLILERLRAAGKTILISSHIYETLTQSCDRITLMQGAAAPETFERPAFDELGRRIKSGYQQKFRGVLDVLLPETSAG